MRLLIRIVILLIPIIICMPVLWIMAYGFGGVREANEFCKDLIVTIIEGEI